MSDAQPVHVARLHISSQEWLKAYGLDAAGVSMNKILSSLGFQQRTGPVRIRDHSVTISSRYGDGVFLRHPDASGNVYNLVRAEEGRLSRVLEQLAQMVNRLKERLKWLNSGSRKLFGVLAGEKVLVVLCGGGSSKSSQQVRQAVSHLLNEQGTHWTHLNILQYGRQWQERLAEVNSDTLSQAVEWLQSANSGDQENATATSLDDAVEQILCQEEPMQIDAIYLIVNGNVPPSKLAEKVAECPVPLHVVCFNCSAEASLKHCQQLATSSRGRCYVNSTCHPSLSLPRPDVMAVWKELGRTRGTLAEVQSLQLEVASKSARAQPASANTHNVRRKKKTTKKVEKSKQRPVVQASQSLSVQGEGSGATVAESSSATGGQTKECIKRWLRRNSLVAQQLTLLDALGPAAVPQSPSYVPATDRNVYGKVFRNIFPLVHLSAGDGHVTLLNPTGFDLKRYEDKLEQQKTVYSKKLDQTIWMALSTDSQQRLRDECRLEVRNIPSFQEHRQQLLSALAEAGWPVAEEELLLLENEMALADNFLRYSRALREERTRPDPIPPPPKPRPRSIQRTQMLMKGNKVLASCRSDGLYYQGSVVRCPSLKRVKVKFAADHSQETLFSQVLLVGGAGSHPVLHVGDFVLCCIQGRQGWHCTKHGLLNAYFPSQIQAVPADVRCGHALYTVTTCSGCAVTCPRSALEKISESKYHEAADRIWRKERAKCKNTQTPGPQVKDGETNTVYHEAVSQLTQTEEREAREVSVGTDPPVRLEDKNTCTEPAPTEDKGTGASPCTAEQGVGTGPLMQDQATLTENTGEDEWESDGDIETDGYDLPDSPHCDLVGQSVLGRWPDDGWYYRAVVVGRGGREDSWLLQTETGDTAEVLSDDIITNDEDAMHPIALGSPVLALHPSFSQSFAPAVVVSVGATACTMQFYDGLQEYLLRRDVYGISPQCHEAAVQYIHEQEQSLVGKAVVARRDSDGVYYTAIVKRKLSGQWYEVQWCEEAGDGASQEQSVVHVFGSMVQPRSMHIGDHVIALAIPSTGVFLPGVVLGRQDPAGIIVQFSDGQKQVVAPEQCFWITAEYFAAAVEYISRAYAAENDLSVDGRSSQASSLTEVTAYST